MLEKKGKQKIRINLDFPLFLLTFIGIELPLSIWNKNTNENTILQSLPATFYDDVGQMRMVDVEI